MEDKGRPFRVFVDVKDKGFLLNFGYRSNRDTEVAVSTIEEVVSAFKTQR